MTALTPVNKKSETILRCDVSGGQTVTHRSRPCTTPFAKPSHRIIHQDNPL